MRPLYQSLLTILMVACLLVVFFAWRWGVAAGLFTSVTPVSPGTCRVMAALPGSGSFAIDAPRNLMFVASTDPRHPGAHDGIYVVSLDDPKAAPVYLPPGLADFHPGSISLYRTPDGSETLMAINRKAKYPTVEIFAVHYDGATPKLASQSTIAGGLLVDPSDLVAVAPDHFYLTNAHATRSGLQRFAEDKLLWAHSDLLFFDGMSFHIAVQRLGAPNGVQLAPDGAHLYVTAANERRLIAFSREPFTGNLTEAGSLPIPARLDKISLDASGDLIVTGQPSLMRMQDFQADPAKPSPSDVFRVRLDRQGVPQGTQPLYANDGQQIGAASAAAIRNGHLFIGSALDDKLLDCAIK